MPTTAPDTDLPSLAIHGVGAARALPVVSPGNLAHRTSRAGRWARWAIPIVGISAIAALGARILTSRAEAPVHYETVAVDRGRIDAKVTATGTVSALVTVQVGSQVSGRVDHLFVDFSSPVKKGQVVATIDPSLLRAAAEQAHASYLAAQAAVEKAKAQRIQTERQHLRVQQLRSEGLASQSDLDVAESNARVARADVAACEAQVAQARAALDQAKQNLAYATITSPIDGVVISRNVDVGQTVAAALQAPTLFTIAQDLTKMQVDTSVAEADVGKLSEGMSVTFTVDAYPGRPFQGRVRQIRDAAQMVQSVVTYDAVIDVDNSGRLLKPGMTASVTVVYAQRVDALRLPNGALRFKPDPQTTAAMTAARPPGAPSSAPPPSRAADERTVWILREGRTLERSVRIGITDGASTEVVAGDVREGDSAITEATLEASAAKHP